MNGIENIRYDIVSRGLHESETLPNSGDTISLHVYRTDPYEEEAVVEEANILAEYIEMLGPYVHILGLATISEANSLPCEAHYLLGAEHTEGEKIGDLILKKTNEQV